MKKIVAYVFVFFALLAPLLGVKELPCLQHVQVLPEKGTVDVSVEDLLFKVSPGGSYEIFHANIERDGKPVRFNSSIYNTRKNVLPMMKNSFLLKNKRMIVSLWRNYTGLVFDVFALEDEDQILEHGDVWQGVKVLDRSIYQVVSAQNHDLSNNEWRLCGTFWGMVVITQSGKALNQEGKEVVVLTQRPPN